MQKKELTNSLRRPDMERIRRFREFVKEKDAVITQESPEMELSAFMTQRALIITDEMNNHYHTPEELHDLLEELTRHSVPTLAPTSSLRTAYMSMPASPCRTRAGSL